MKSYPNVMKSLLIGVLLVAFQGIGTVLTVAQENVTPQIEETKPITAPEEAEIVVGTNDPLEKLFEQLARDPKPSSAEATAKRIWQNWLTSKSKSIDLLMGWAGKAMGVEDYAKAEDILDQVVVLAPDYAEGWNRRATLYFLIDDYSRSIADIESALALEPRHFGALSGRRRRGL